MPGSLLDDLPCRRRTQSSTMLDLCWFCWRLQVAMAGSSTSLFLMDEVDAALDETNQHLVSECEGSFSCRCSPLCRPGGSASDQAVQPTARW